jgi:hypothetical protein
MIDPLGLRITIGEVVTRWFVMGKSWKKWAVLPVSAMTLVEALEGGPKGAVSNSFSANLHASCEASAVRLESVLLVLPGGFPPFQLLRRQG